MGGSILYTAKLDRSTIVILWALELKLDVDLACDGHEYAAFACDPSMQVTANRPQRSPTSPKSWAISLAHATKMGGWKAFICTHGATLDAQARGSTRTRQPKLSRCCALRSRSVRGWPQRSGKHVASADGGGDEESYAREGVSSSVECHRPSRLCQRTTSARGEHPVRPAQGKGAGEGKSAVV